MPRRALLVLLIATLAGGPLLVGTADARTGMRPSAAKALRLKMFVPPMPRPRPTGPEAPVLATPELRPTLAPDAEPSACRKRLTPDLAALSSHEVITGPGECGASDVVTLDAVILKDKRRVAVSPPATLRCTMAEAIVTWVREDIAGAAAAFGVAPVALDNYASYDCRGRNRVFGAKLSEHGRANALDVRSVTLSNGLRIGLTDTLAPREAREALRRSACARFNTVLGPGSDGYHETHVHLDLAERRSGYRMCQWDIRDPQSAAIPLPRPRPAGDAP